MAASMKLRIDSWKGPQGRKLRCICLDFHGGARFLSTMIDELRVNPVGSCSVLRDCLLRPRKRSAGGTRKKACATKGNGKQALGCYAHVVNEENMRRRHMGLRNVANESKPKVGWPLGVAISRWPPSCVAFDKVRRRLRLGSWVFL